MRVKVIYTNFHWILVNLPDIKFQPYVKTFMSREMFRESFKFFLKKGTEFYLEILPRFYGTKLHYYVLNNPNWQEFRIKKKCLYPLQATFLLLAVHQACRVPLQEEFL